MQGQDDNNDINNKEEEEEEGETMEGRCDAQSWRRQTQQRCLMFARGQLISGRGSSYGGGSTREDANVLVGGGNNGNQ